ncbi:hypothetical protein [Sphingomonas sp. Leaf242]|uniref:hypothetical protein n=1 Tax=Sphingomonas sp. Leaf242 TaxID=1736304 RepID=UPI000AF7650F|nr:hypothetical protein [Sphingomonas sp. Leaf242]
MIQSPSHAALHIALASELRRVSALVEQLAETLVGDEDFVMRHIDQLQVFDLIVQSADESAAVLDRVAGGITPDAAIAPVRLSAIQGRLHAALALAAMPHAPTAHTPVAHALEAQAA